MQFNLKFIVGLVVIITIASGFLYWQYSRMSEEVIQDETADWKIYHNEELGISFKYPPNWISGGGFEPTFSIRSIAISSFPEICELGLCQPNIEKLKRKINDGTIDGFIEFAGGKGFIENSCTVSSPPLSPWYKLNFIKDNNWVSFSVIDYKTVWPRTTDRQEECSRYINKITLPDKVSDERYKAYNDFITIIQQSLVIAVTQDETASWKTYRDDEFKFEVKYPEKLETEFIRIQSPLPPKITVIRETPGFICGSFEREVYISNQRYCVELMGDSGAGTAFKDYKYTTEKEEKIINLELTLAYPNCGNFYGIDNKQEICNVEETTFNPDVLADQILSTFRFIESNKDESYINTENWELYTDLPFGKNFLGYSIPGWLLEVKLPPSFDGDQGVFLILEEGTKEPTGVELQFGVDLRVLGSDFENEAKRVIIEYQNMRLGSTAQVRYFEEILKVDDINIRNGCVGPQIFTEGINGSLSVMSYQTFCIMGDNIGEATMIFEMKADPKDKQALQNLKPLYDSIISTFQLNRQ